MLAQRTGTGASRGETRQDLGDEKGVCAVA
jgi:hypothetical protein